MWHGEAIPQKVSNIAWRAALNRRAAQVLRPVILDKIGGTIEKNEAINLGKDATLGAEVRNPQSSTLNP